MPDRKALTHDELHELLASLDRVMDDAEQLRRQISQQLADVRAHDQQQVSPLSEPWRRRRSSGD